ncbi:MAG: ATP-dependent DNA helicase [Verrucomicrobia bacterium]|nr:ATP-dependent DNA helicase [Verrucomicrobiota bacterium]
MAKEPDNAIDAQGTLPWLADLNPQQRQAVVHMDGPLLVVAGAGSGKTRTIAYRVAHLIARGADPTRILLLTFTRRAAEEMINRAAGIVEKGRAVCGQVWGGTFHASANRLLRIYAKAAGLSADFTVMDQADSEDMLNVVRHEQGLHSKDKRFPKKGTCLAIYSRCVNGTEPIADVLSRYFPWCEEWEKELKGLFKHYVSRKQERNVMDYDDLLLYWAQLLEDEGLARQIGGKFDHILVDEYQDTNKVQADILRGMRKFNRNIMVVGDDAQSIYSFRAATVRNMLDFPKHFPGTTIVTLDQNYRSVAPILSATNLVISQSTERFTKELWSARTQGERPKLVTCKDEHAQNDYVIARAMEHLEQGIPLRRQAVLFRAAHLSDTLEVELARRKISYHKYGGLRFLEAAHVKDLIAFMRVIENPRDEMAWFRVLQLLDGIGPGTAARMITHVSAANNDPRSIAGFSAPPSAREHVSGLGQLFKDLCLQSKQLPPAPQISRIRQFYNPILRKLYDNPVVRARDLESLEQIAAGYKSAGKFLVDLQLDPPTSTSDLAGPPTKDEDWLVLSTIHSAKGCEWDVVYLIHATDGCLPSDMSTGTKEEIEEELRLTYVAMTRAKDFLYVTRPLRYYHKWYAFTDKHVYAQLSRFFTRPVVESMDAVDLAQEAASDEVAGSGPAMDIHSKMRNRWD